MALIKSTSDVLLVDVLLGLLSSILFTLVIKCVQFVPAVFVTRSYILRTNAYGIHRLRDSSTGMRVSSRRAQSHQIAANLNLRFEMPA